MEDETAPAEESELPLSNLEFDNTGYCNITFPGFGTKASMSTAAKVIYLWVLMHPDGVLLSQRFDAQEKFLKKMDLETENFLGVDLFNLIDEALSIGLLVEDKIVALQS